jgi:hypothetical protein
LTNLATERYQRGVKTDSLFESLKEWVATANPGFVRGEDLMRLEGRLDELTEIVTRLEGLLKKRPPTGAGKRPRRRP